MPEGCARRALAGWRNGLTLRGSAKGSAKFGIWGGTGPCSSTNWGQMAGKQLCRGGLGCPGGQAEHEPAMWQKKADGVHYLECPQQIEGGDHSLSAQQ